MKLGVNVDHVATLRQARGGRFPDPLEAVKICEKIGVHSVVMHLREDKRHVQNADLFRVRRGSRIRLNMEMSIAPSVLPVALKLKPDQATLVPERRQERTTEGGLNLFHKTRALENALMRLNKKNIFVSLFIDPDLKQVKKARELGVRAVEFHTGDYAAQTSAAGVRRELTRLRRAVLLARVLGLRVYAGHGLDYANVVPLRAIKGIEELNIGYSIVTRALWVGFEKAVSEMLERIR